MFASFKEHYIKCFEDRINDYGGKIKKNEEMKCIFRKNIGDPYPDKGAYFGCISKDEESTGSYSDLSVVVFPSNEDDDANDRWMICLGVGSLGYKNDYELVSLPGTRRIFIDKLPKESFIKNDFMDVESADGFNSFCENRSIPASLEKGIKNYKKVLLTATIFDPNDKEDSERIISTYLAIYANMRSWPTNDSHRKAIDKVLKSIDSLKCDDEEKVKALLERRKYIVLQGAPGTGKTRLAKEIAKGFDKTFFTQFHAETSYSDFVYGILPDVDDSEKLKYKGHEGILVEAIRAAKDSEESVCLIIDEINRANLSNVLGPTFYLFEPTMADSDILINICPELSLKKLPDNLYVIATMNTADRSLAVVDFALRRRFAWYTLHPHAIEADNGFTFCEEQFNSISLIFEKYATDEELNLQPGHAYFIVPEENKEEYIKDRMKYEIMPLIKEYLLDGMLARAKDDFVNYFRQTLDVEMFR